MKRLGAIMVLLAACGCDSRPSGSAGPSVAAPVGGSSVERAAPEAVYVSGGEGPFSVAAFKGRVVLLDFWATWSAPATSAIPNLNRLQEDYGEHGLTVVGMVMDEIPGDELAGRVQACGPIYPVVSAPPDAARRFGPVRAVPTRFLLDRSGTLRGQFPGHVEVAAIRESIDSLLVEP